VVESYRREKGVMGFTQAVIFIACLSLGVIASGEKCEVVKLLIDNQNITKEDGIEVVGSSTYASCSHSSATISLYQTDEVSNFILMRFSQSKDSMRSAKPYAEVEGGKMLHFGRSLRVIFSNTGKQLPKKAFFGRLLKNSKGGRMVDREKGYFSFEMKSIKRASSTGQPLVSLNLQGGDITTLFAFVNKYTVGPKVVNALARVSCEDSGKSSVPVTLEVEGMVHGPVMYSAHQFNFRGCTHSRFDCIWKGDFLRNVKSTQESYEGFRKCVDDLEY